MYLELRLLFKVMGAVMDETPVNLLAVGDAGIGKRSMLVRFGDDSFQEEGSDGPADFSDGTPLVKSKIVECGTFGKIKVNLSDLGGSEFRSALTSSVFRGKEGILLCFDVTNKSTLTNLSHWYKETQHCSSTASEHIIVVGLKADAPEEKWVKPKSELDLAEYGPLFFASAKTGDGVNEAVTALAKAVASTQSAADLEEQKCSITVKKKKKNFLTRMFTK